VLLLFPKITFRATFSPDINVAVASSFYVVFVKPTDFSETTPANSHNECKCSFKVTDFGIDNACMRFPISEVAQVIVVHCFAFNIFAFVPLPFCLAHFVREANV